jgi:hypothetical protein
LESLEQRAARRAEMAAIRTPNENDFVDDGQGIRLRRGHGNIDAALDRANSRWLHVPPRDAVEVVLLADEPVAYEGHFTRGVLVPCIGSTICQFCGEVGMQERFVQICKLPGDERIWLWDYSVFVAKLVDAEFRYSRNVSTRGLRLELYRSPCGRNTPIICRGFPESPIDEEAAVFGYRFEDAERMVMRALRFNLSKVRGKR